MCHTRSLQEPVRVLAIFIACLTLVVGISSIIHGGDLEMSLIGLLVNLSIAGVLFYGAKKKDTTHLVVWLVFSLIQMIGLIIGACYFAYESEQVWANYNVVYRKESMEIIWKLRVTYVVYSLVFGVLTIVLFSISIIVKKFYDELQRRETDHPYGKQFL